MEEILANVGKILAPSDFWDVFIYGMFFLSLLTMAFIPDKNQQPTLLMSAVLLVTIIDKVRRAAGADIPIEGFDDEGFAVLLIHIIMFTFPLMSAGLLRIRGKQGRQARPLSIVTGLLGGMYAVAWFLVFNAANRPPAPRQ